MIFERMKTPGIAHVAYLIGNKGEAAVVCSWERHVARGDFDRQKQIDLPETTIEGVL